MFEEAIEYINKAKKILVICGAGISTNSGISDFRSSNGIFAQIKQKYHLSKPDDIFDIDSFRKNPGIFFEIFKPIHESMLNAKPTSTHMFIKYLEDIGKLMAVYTQNIDNLELKAGIKNVYQCHGSISTSICQNKSCNATYSMETSYESYICKSCNKGILKPSIVFYGENINHHYSIIEDAKQCDLLLIMGTSLRVNPIAFIPSILKDYIPIIIINKEPIQINNPNQKIISLIGDCDFMVNQLK